MHSIISRITLYFNCYLECCHTNKCIPIAMFQRPRPSILMDKSECQKSIIINSVNLEHSALVHMSRHLTFLSLSFLICKEETYSCYDDKSSQENCLTLLNKVTYYLLSPAL